MGQEIKEFSLRTRSKFLMVFLFLFVGIPMTYAAYLNYTVGELLFSGLMVLLFLLWAVVIVIANGYKIKLTENSIHRQGLISPSIIDFKDIQAIHFGSTWSNFYVESDDKKVYFGKDFDNYEQILQGLVDEVRTVKNLEDVRLLGDAENIEPFVDSD